MAGNIHSCAMVAGGQLRCWGYNNSGQLGDNSTTERHLPTTVLRPDGAGPLTGATQVSAGFHTCARLANTQAVCWGNNFQGQVGDGNTAVSAQNLPRLVTLPNGGNLTGIATVAAGDDFTCARLTSGRVRCWGDNDGGRLGDGTTTDRSRAVLVTMPGGAPLTGVTQLSVGRSHSCARLTTGQARCWGDNTSGPIGDGTTTNRRRATVVRASTGSNPLTGVVQISADDDHSCARLGTGQARCWGENGSGQIGDGTTADRLRPRPVLDPTGTIRLSGVRQVAASQGFTCARLASGQARCWGGNVDGGLGDGTTSDRTLPVVVHNPMDNGPLSGVTSISAGGSHACARLGAADAVCWGGNNAGQLGDGTLTDRPIPVVVQA